MTGIQAHILVHMESIYPLPRDILAAKRLKRLILGRGGRKHHIDRLLRLQKLPHICGDVFSRLLPHLLSGFKYFYTKIIQL